MIASPQWRSEYIELWPTGEHGSAFGNREVRCSVAQLGASCAAFSSVVLCMFWCVVGCGGATTLSAGDALRLGPDGPVMLWAHLDREAPLWMRQGVEGHVVSFVVENTEVAQAVTDDIGTASAACHLPNPAADSVEVRAVVGGRPLRAAGTVYTFRPARILIIVDIDGTLADTEIESLLLDGEDSESEPLKHARAAMRDLAEHSDLLYLTARPRSLLEKTRKWLDHHQFPRAPLFVAPDWRSAVYRPSDFKRDILAEICRRWPNALIGIGDRLSDADAYRANGMLPVMILDESDIEDLHELPDDVMVFEDWRSLDDYFTANREILGHPVKLREAMRCLVADQRASARIDDD